MRTTTIATRSVLCVAAALSFAVIPAAAGNADDPAAHASGAEGSLNDTQNIANTASNDALASAPSEVGFDLNNLAVANAATAGGGKGCNGYTTKPAERANTSSPTNREIFITLHAECVGGDNQFRVTIRIERSRWYGWQTLTSRTTEDNGSNPWYYHRDLATSCRAGTWSYRNWTSGGWGGQSGNIYTSSYRTTCVDKNDLGAIDLS